MSDDKETPIDLFKEAKKLGDKAKGAKVLGDDNAAQSLIDASHLKLNEAVEAELKRVEEEKK